MTEYTNIRYLMFTNFFYHGTKIRPLVVIGLYLRRIHILLGKAQFNMGHHI